MVRPRAGPSDRTRRGRRDLVGWARRRAWPVRGEESPGRGGGRGAGPSHRPHPDAARPQWSSRDVAGLCRRGHRARQRRPHRRLGWLHPAESNGYHHRVTYLRGEHALASELLPRVHRVVSLLKRWLLGTHQGRVGHAHLDYYLDEHVPVQPASVEASRQVVLPARSAGRCHGAHAVPTARPRRPQPSSLTNHKMLGSPESIG